MIILNINIVCYKKIFCIDLQAGQRNKISRKRNNKNKEREDGFETNQERSKGTLVSM